VNKLQFLKTTAIAPLVQDLEPVVIDLGTRGGVDEDFLSAAWASTVIGFEPESDEYDSLQKKIVHAWKSVVMVPSAVGAITGRAELFIPSSEEGASLLPHNPEMIELFGYSNLHETKRTLSVETLTLDEIAKRFNIPHVDYLKIDVEGAELDILQAAPLILQRCLAIKVETSFLMQRQNQPLTWEVISFLYDKGFWLVDMIDIHRWRRQPVPAHPYIVDYVMPYSKGVLAQCDLIFLKDFRKFDNEVDALRLSVTAVILGFFDYGISVLRHFPEVAKTTETRYGIDLEASYSLISSGIGRQECKETVYRTIRNLLPLLRSYLGGLPRIKNLLPY
jgi:FkbM family methyltransferase